MAQVGLAFLDGSGGGRNDGALSAFALVLGLQVNNFCSLLQTPRTPGPVQPSQVPLESSMCLWWQTGISHCLFVSLDRLTCLSQQRNCVFLPRV